MTPCVLNTYRKYFPLSTNRKQVSILLALMKTVTLSIGTVCIRPLNTFHPLASIQTTSVSIRYQLLLSNHTIKNIQSSICKFEVPLFHLHSKLSNPLFLSHPFGNRHDYMHGKTLLGKSNGFKSFSLQMFPPGEGKKKKKKL